MYVPVCANVHSLHFHKVYNSPMYSFCIIINARSYCVTLKVRYRVYISDHKRPHVLVECQLYTLNNTVCVVKYTVL